MNQLKILLHRASMKMYEKELKAHKHNVVYVDYSKHSTLSTILKSLHIQTIGAFDPVDHLLQNRLQSFCDQHHFHLDPWMESPNFIATLDDLEAFRTTLPNHPKHILQLSFYTFMRKKYSILMDAKGKPMGGQYSFDPKNRLPYDSSKTVPGLYKKSVSEKRKEQRVVKEAIAYVRHYFSDHPGNTQEIHHLLFTRQSAQHALEHFITHKLSHFGDYQDAFSLTDPFLFHSNLSHAINIGLLDPMECVTAAIQAYQNNPEEIRINNVEGFVRQMLGWREYSRFTYHYFDERIRQSNVMKSNGRLTSSWYEGTTGWAPVDHTIRQAFKWGYLHHIQRLMLMGNVMNLMKFHPHEVYRWYMEFAIDSYDWVMVNNVYSMILFADGGFLTTKPYIASDNYLVKMSNGQFKRDGKWDADLKSLYYSYIAMAPTVKGKNLFQDNARTRMMYAMWSKQSEEAKQQHLSRAKQVLSNPLLRSTS